MAAHRKSDRRRDDLCAGGLRKCVAIAAALLAASKFIEVELVWSNVLLQIASRERGRVEREFIHLLLAFGRAENQESMA
jgi:hypothetical protein